MARPRATLTLDDLAERLELSKGSASQGLKYLRELGAVRVVAYITHAVLSGAAIERIGKSVLDEIVVTDTIPLSQAGQACTRIRQLSVAGLLAETIRRISDEESVSSLYVD